MVKELIEYEVEFTGGIYMNIRTNGIIFKLDGSYVDDETHYLVDFPSKTYNTNRDRDKFFEWIRKNWKMCPEAFNNFKQWIINYKYDPEYGEEYQY